MSTDPVVRIQGAQDPRLHDYTGLTDVALRTRREPAEGLYIAESTSVVRRALAAGHRPRSLLMSPRWLDETPDLVAAAGRAGAPVFVAEPDVLQRITGFHVHRGALASMHRPTPPPWQQVVSGARRVVVLEDLVDHTNLGAIFRGAAGLGVDAVLVSPRSADPLYRRSVRVSMGTVFQVPWARVDPWPQALDVLRRDGFTTAALALRQDAVDLAEVADDPPDRLAWVLGTEGAGLSPGTIDGCDLAVRIPMAGGVDSLNVAAAAAVAFWATR